MRCTPGAFLGERQLSPSDCLPHLFRRSSRPANAFCRTRRRTGTGSKIRIKCEALLRKGGKRSRKTFVFQRRSSPFLKPRPMDAFRIFLPVPSPQTCCQKASRATFASKHAEHSGAPLNVRQGKHRGTVTAKKSPHLYVSLFSNLTSMSKLAAIAAEKQRSCGLRIVIIIIQS